MASSGLQLYQVNDNNNQNSTKKYEVKQDGANQKCKPVSWYCIYLKPITLTGHSTLVYKYNFYIGCN